LKAWRVRPRPSPACRRPSDQASGCLATRLQGGAVRGRVCAFLATRAEHPNTQAWGRRKDVKVFGCSDDLLDGALRRLTGCQLTRDRAEMAVAFGRGCGFASGRLLGGNWTRDGILQLEGEANSPCLGAHEAHPKNYFVWGCFPKIELAPAYVDPGARFAFISTSPSATASPKRHLRVRSDYSATR
jgi:hypothetical protein